MGGKSPVVHPDLTENLRCGRRALVGMDRVEILQDWQ